MQRLVRLDIYDLMLATHTSNKPKVTSTELLLVQQGERASELSSHENQCHNLVLRFWRIYQLIQNRLQ